MWVRFRDLREQSSVRKKKRRIIIEIATEIRKTIKDSNVLESFKLELQLQATVKRFLHLQRPSRSTYVD